MNNKTIVEAIPKEIFDFSDLKPLVYEFMREKSTPMRALEFKDLSCTLSMTVPRGINMKNRDPADYVYLVIRIEEEDG